MNHGVASAWFMATRTGNNSRWPSVTSQISSSPMAVKIIENVTKYRRHICAFSMKYIYRCYRIWYCSQLCYSQRSPSSHTSYSENAVDTTGIYSIVDLYHKSYPGIIVTTNKLPVNELIKNYIKRNLLRFLLLTRIWRCK